MELDRKIEQLINVLKNRYGSNVQKDEPFKVLISTILSQRTKDEVTEEVALQLFSRHKRPEEITGMDEKEIGSIIKKVGFYNVKARWIKQISSILIEKWNSKVPSDISGLLSLPGVGRKTANCVLAYGFGIPALPVDTHVHRISNRIGLVNTSTPEDTEKALMKIIPKRYWGWLNTSLVRFGQRTCKPIKPLCENCELSGICVYGRGIICKKMSKRSKSPKVMTII